MPVRSTSIAPTDQPNTIGDSQGDLDVPGTSGELWETLPLNVTDIQSRAIELIIQGFKDTQVAQTLGINRKTLWNWKSKDDNYRNALNEARAVLHGSTADRCQNFAHKAAAVLAEFLEEGVQANNRLRAAQILLSAASRFKPVPEMRERIPTQKEIDNYYFPPPDMGPKVG